MLQIRKMEKLVVVSKQHKRDYLVETAPFAPLGHDGQLTFLGDTSHEQQNIDVARLSQHGDLVPESDDLGRGRVHHVQGLDGHGAVPVAAVHRAEGSRPDPRSDEYLVDGDLPVLRDLALVPAVPLDLLLAAVVGRGCALPGPHAGGAAALAAAGAGLARARGGGQRGARGRAHVLRHLPHAGDATGRGPQRGAVLVRDHDAVPHDVAEVGGRAAAVPGADGRGLPGVVRGVEWRVRGADVRARGEPRHDDAHHALRRAGLPSQHVHGQNLLHLHLLTKLGNFCRTLLVKLKATCSAAESIYQ